MERCGNTYLSSSSSFRVRFRKILVIPSEGQNAENQGERGIALSFDCWGVFVLFFLFVISSRLCCYII